MKNIKHSRREFLGLTGACVAGTVAAPWLNVPPAAAQTIDTHGADLVVFNAKVYTMDNRTPRAEAFAVKAGRFVAVGRTTDIKGLIAKETQTIDARQTTIVPGFTDCHNHAPGTTLLYEVLVGNPFEVEFVTIRSIVDKLRARAQETPAGTWVDGYFFDDTKVKDQRLLNVHDLDEVSKEQPVAVHHRGGHTSFYNSKALELAGVTKNAKDPAGGTFDRDEHGDLNGRVTDRARGVFANVGSRQTLTADETAQRSRDGLAHISYEVNGRVLEAMITSGIATGFGDEWIRLGATSEHTVDGSFSERTMALSIPYPGVTPPYKGNITETQDELNAWVERVHRAGIQINCHANGDVAIDMVLTAVERAQKLFPRPDARPKITHCTLINDDLLRRIKATGTIPACFTSYAYYNTDKFRFYGEELMKRAMPFRSFLDAGVPACAGSDFSPGPFAPLMGIQGMVTRTGWNGETWGANQRVSVDEAIRINTLNGAYASREETIKGSISASKLADFVILADDPHTADPSKIKDIRIVRTVVGGSTMYQA